MVTISRRRGTWTATITPAGLFYLTHGHHPDHPNNASESAPPNRDTSSRPAPTASYSQPHATKQPAQKPRPGKVSKSEAPKLSLPGRRHHQAVDLLEQLSSAPHVTIMHPRDEEIAEWRRDINYAKRHGLEPEGKRIETTRMLYSRDKEFVIRLVDGPHPNSKRDAPDQLPPVPVPAQLRSLHPVVESLREDRQRLVMPAALRHRSLRILQGLAAEAARRGHRVYEIPVPERAKRHPYYSALGQPSIPSYSLREGELGIGIDEFDFKIIIDREFPQAATRSAPRS
ncbi:hypothetical protein [Streptomyces sp. GS7]|uniref:hypothetical protein n=1 Tax=Streptomyces sp. GS7 TaxID=2692234 RepID=UPI0013160899|nr:hypothetical protein [Streptomyces sp. GS7]QHC23356.1 hypothetical protein GR130_20130 [Streptomyces sp. GS7]